ncbi:unnamed protein product [Soboliphyme baturini]|uniref:Uncharacterized protein n=1 Tax=Soboliphyme baturini TaxID=241478 RepID=A0A183IP84_9BILA|nr:unnamed protein product [Soboliphyme baturini]
MPVRNALPDVSFRGHAETGKASDLSKEAHFSRLYPGSKFCSDDSPLMTVVPSRCLPPPFRACGYSFADWCLRRRFVGLLQPSLCCHVPGWQRAMSRF